MPKFKDLTGQKIGRLTIVSYFKEKNISGRSMIYYTCICDCGNKIIVQGQHLSSGHTQSCGCFQSQRAKEAKTKHGYCSRKNRARTYAAYQDMKTRALNKNRESYKNYGGRGIIIDSRWLDSEKGFLNFLEDMGECPKGYSLDRIDNNGPYCKENCRWATKKQQAQNTRKNIWYKDNGIEMVQTDWMKKLKVSRSFIIDRLNKNIPFPEIVRQAREYNLKQLVKRLFEVGIKSGIISNTFISG